MFNCNKHQIMAGLYLPKKLAWSRKQHTMNLPLLNMHYKVINITSFWIFCETYTYTLQTIYRLHIHLQIQVIIHLHSIDRTLQPSKQWKLNLKYKIRQTKSKIMKPTYVGISWIKLILQKTFYTAWNLYKNLKVTGQPNE